MMKSDQSLCATAEQTRDTPESADYFNHHVQDRVEAMLLETMIFGHSED